MRNFTSSIPALAMLAGLTLGAAAGAAEPVQERIVVVAAAAFGPDTQAYTVEAGRIGHGRIEGAVLTAFADTVMLRTGPDELVRLRTVGGEATHYQPGDHLVVERWTVEPAVVESGARAAQPAIYTSTASDGAVVAPQTAASPAAAVAPREGRGTAQVAESRTPPSTYTDDSALREEPAPEAAGDATPAAKERPTTTTLREVIGLLAIVALAAAIGWALLLSRASR